MRLESITPIVLSFNEAPNLGRTLEGLRWATKLILVDSGSTDGTLQIASKFDNVHVLSRPFDTFAAQRNFALDQVATDWVLSLDADYQVGPDLVAEMEVLEAGDLVAFQASFRYLIFGKPLRRSILPSRPVLFRRRVCRYVDDGHAERLEFDGPAGTLRSKIDHDDRKSLSRWLAAQDHYAIQEAAKLNTATPAELGLADRIRRWKWVAPWLVPIICLLQCGVVLDGWRGFYYALQRGLAESLLALRIIEREWASKRGKSPQ